MNNNGNIIFEAAALPNGKRGILKDCGGGYKEIVLGAFNAFNASGHFYSYSENSKLAQIFHESSDFMRRIAAGQLYSEYEHPKADPKMTRQELFVRRLTVDADRVAAHIRKVTLVPDAVEDVKGRRCIAVIGEVAPAGPFGKYVEESFNNPSQNTAFSVRCFTKDTPISGVLYKQIVELVTWDFVSEPGIKCASKFDTPSLESYSISDMNKVIEKIKNNNLDGYSQESYNDILNKTKSLIQQSQLNPTKNKSNIFNW
jgi:hypothetical protein